jgi:uridine kinase
MAQQRKPLIVGIGGGTASGKSTLTAALNSSLANHSFSAHIISMDTYFRRQDRSAPHIVWSVTGEPEFDCNHVNSADVDKLLRDLDELVQSNSSPDVLFVEGLMVLAVDDLRQRCDLKLYVDLADDLRLARRLLRDMSSQRRFTEPDKIVRYYVESARVGHIAYVEPSKQFADLTIRGDADLDRSASFLLPIILKQLEG